MLKVSAIVPVYNPGSDIDDCIRTLLDQSLPRDEYEVIFVDDGSTDGTGERLDALAAEHPHVRVDHIPNSGWPGRPRNVGIDMARGEFVYFVDNDDWVGHEALERLYATAQRTGADVVVGKVVGHGSGKSIPAGLFRQNRDDVDLHWNPLLWLLTPHKLFRRQLLDDEGIRFPEGRRRLEDHPFVMHAYFHAKRVSVLADYPCYHWVLRDVTTNASMHSLDPASYYQNLREVLDLIDEHTEPGEFRDRLYVRWYHGKVLRRMGGAVFAQWPEEVRRGRYEHARPLALERFDERLDQYVPFSLRLRSRLLRADDYAGIVALAQAESKLRVTPRIREVRWHDGCVDLKVEARFGGGVLTFERRGDRVHWVPGEGLAGLREGSLDVTDAVAAPKMEIYLRAMADRTDWPLRFERDARLEPAGDDGGLELVLTADVTVSPEHIPGQLAAGAWSLVTAINVAGFKPPTTRLRHPHGTEPFFVHVDGTGKIEPQRAPIRQRVLGRAPWLVPAVRAARRLRSRATR